MEKVISTAKMKESLLLTEKLSQFLIADSRRTLIEKGRVSILESFSSGSEK